MPEDTPRSVRRGRPPNDAAESHARIMDTVYALLQERSVRDLTMEAVARKAGVGKPTLYKWWPTKASIVMAMFHERIAGKFEEAPFATVEEAIRAKVRRLIREFNGLFGKVMGDLLAEGQSDAAVLQEMHDKHFSQRRASTIADIERGIREGEFLSDTNAELLLDALVGPIYYRLLLRFPLTEQFGEDLVGLVLRSVKVPTRDTLAADGGAAFSKTDP